MASGDAGRIGTTWTTRIALCGGTFGYAGDLTRCDVRSLASSLTKYRLSKIITSGLLIGSLQDNASAGSTNEAALRCGFRLWDVLIRCREPLWRVSKREVLCEKPDVVLVAHGEAGGDASRISGRTQLRPHATLGAVCSTFYGQEQSTLPKKTLRELSTSCCQPQDEAYNIAACQALASTGHAITAAQPATSLLRQLQEEVGVRPGA
ncbi:hypothetical protein MKZ38_003344 [Zalerion maritima]|uniref:Uncharacterized protein n=1 Tax=Zalerion maritima TaxID=339359 RepID=A0AAD5WQQ1_9PEZI|nr:hypothetical protein MKZ38_003344 [Zalerion maritima]